MIATFFKVLAFIIAWFAGIAFFGLTDQASEEDVKMAWRRLASIHHPDKGGDPATFVKLRQSYEQALAASQVPKPCTNCNGLKFELSETGFLSIKLICKFCKGSGVLS
jgi:DnaJ family protein A protein 2